MKPKTETKPIVVNEHGSMVEHINTVCRLACNSKLAQEIIDQAAPDLRVISDYFELTQMEALLFCDILYINFTSESVDLLDFARFVECSPISAFSMQKHLDSLVSKQVLKVFQSNMKRRNRQKSKLCMFEYYVPDDLITKSIWGGEKFIPQCINKADSIFDLFLACSEQFKSLMDETTTIPEVLYEIQTLLSHNSHLQFIKDLKKEMLDVDAQLLFLACCREFLDEVGEINLSHVIKSIYKSDLRKQMKTRQSILNGTHPLLEKGLITTDASSFRSDSIAELTQRTLKLLLPDDMDFIKPKSKQDPNQIVILCNSIVEKRLYFCPDLQQQLDFLTDVLQPKNYLDLVKRLSEAGMPQGICVLLHGERPGTGKTESVYQIARQTGRAIHPVNLAFRNKYYGESEQAITRIFKNYSISVEKSEIAPILFINEADAILNTRKKVGSSVVDQTENTIQNILLEQIEVLKGVLICTTNLTINLDPAFERRFLFKIQYDAPVFEAKQAIWKDKIKSLTGEQAMKLAEQFDFSGGQIENVARKVLMTGVLNGRQPDFLGILAFCREESLHKRKETGRIGYLQ